MSLTIIIPTIGRSTLFRAVESVEAQTIPTKYVVQVDEVENGAAITRNQAIQTVQTNWVGFCDDDDYLDPHYHQWLKKYQQTADLVIFQMQRPDGMILPDHTSVNKLAYNWVGISFAIRTELAKAFPFKNMVGEDWDMITTMKQAHKNIVIAPEVAYFIG